MSANWEYKHLLESLYIDGKQVPARNHGTLRRRDWSHTFAKFPLVTVRKTAWKKALREMEWFMSGDAGCPEELRDWWAGQLSADNCLYLGYPGQLRRSQGANGLALDQVEFLLQEVQRNPYSRRLVMSAWNSADMQRIQIWNTNPNTPACCHGTTIQLFVEDGKLYMTHYQRSADVMLGLPHNLVQYWALLMYFAHHTGLAVGDLHYIVGDLHLYAEISHLMAAQSIVAMPFDDRSIHTAVDVQLVYNYSHGVDDAGVPIFRASDFSIDGTIPEPVTTIRPKLL
jgi:thymidylate synthase